MSLNPAVREGRDNGRQMNCSAIHGMFCRYEAREMDVISGPSSPNAKLKGGAKEQALE